MFRGDLEDNVQLVDRLLRIVCGRSPAGPGRRFGTLNLAGDEMPRRLCTTVIVSKLR